MPRLRSPRLIPRREPVQHVTPELTEILSRRSVNQGHAVGDTGPTDVGDQARQPVYRARVVHRFAVVENASRRTEVAGHRHSDVEYHRHVLAARQDPRTGPSGLL